ncbi:MAG: hypothetical protein SPJ93_13475 [Treponema sp.]|nr:hypothetical protein [Treponema sp.]
MKLIQGKTPVFCGRRVFFFISNAKFVKVYANLDNLSQKILITADELDYSTSVVRHVKLKDFLLMNDLSLY